ncbi:SIS domain-containing protein [Microbacterium sp. W4I20]|uniref:SIS domain-containing protein n=1 Tax=Microbacterium sp. W4I20 TaxID=3042262 RepID=UPI002787B32F|nr:sugar isomerase [Microbacterium sp. W4I20]MDQ0727062.1 glucosamine--fructose-6-phosphate aminotransferase (isomerizing) [Microbacterium sp. W4I20]
MNETTATSGVITRAELMSQPEIWQQALDLTEKHSALLPAAGEKVLVIGCGTSYYMGDAYAYLRNDAGLGRTRAAIPSELDWIDDDEHIVVISRSGTTADVVELVERYGSTHRVTAILGDTNTALGLLCADRTVHLDFADEQSIVQTRFATTGLTALRASIGQVSATLVDDARAALAAALPADPAQVQHIVFLGHRWTNGLAQEAALKVRESAGFWTEAYSMWEYQHGPISCAGPNTLVWFLGEAPEVVADDVRSTGASVYVNDLDPQANLPLVHRLAVDLAALRGRNPDTPPFLNRSVLVTD